MELGESSHEVLPQVQSTRRCCGVLNSVAVNQGLSETRPCLSPVTSSGYFAGSWKCLERQNVRSMMTEPAQLSDEDLLDRAHQLRLLALRGHLDARGPAHEHEREVRRRFGSDSTTSSVPLEPVPAKKRMFWRLWNKVGQD